MSMPGFWEWAFLGVLALLIFGPDKLPSMARTVGRTIAQLRQEARGAVDELKRAAELDELRQVGRELKETAGQIEREASAASAAAGQAATAAQQPAAAGRPEEPPEPAAVAQGPPPFDPDAT